MKIAILLATYNSERYLAEQIDSILNQTYQNWELFIRDDGSTDSTLTVIGKYQEKEPTRIKLITDNKGGLRSYYNFMELLKTVSADYYLFSDHDDVWLPEKIESSINEMRYLEYRNANAPIIVHSDMKVVNQDLQVISESFWNYSRLLPDHCTFLDLACCNCVNGCTMLINQKAKEVSIPNINFGVMHDSLVAQSVAANGGIIYAIKEPLVLYRQHVDNVIGAANVRKDFFYGRIWNFVDAITSNIRMWKRVRNIQKVSLSKFLLHKSHLSKLRYSIS